MEEFRKAQEEMHDPQRRKRNWMQWYDM